MEQRIQGRAPIRLEEGPRFDQELGLWSHDVKNFSWALSLSGQGTSLGCAQKGSIEIRAFGPQSYPLVDKGGFGVKGIQRALSVDSSQMHGWARTMANEIWVDVRGKESRLDLRFMGLNSERKMAFVFYVKAQSAQVGSTIYRPKHLQRYSGDASSVYFTQGADRLEIVSPLSAKMELIPLAGEGCYWETDFLLAYELNPFQSHASFCFV